MKKLLTRGGALLGATALAASSLLVTATAAHAADNGTLVINIVDQYGRPTDGQAYAFAVSDQKFYTDPGPVPTTTPSHSFAVRGDEGYGVEVVTPWSGVTCVGVAPCGTSSGATVTAAVAVPAGQTSTLNVTVTVPTITGGTTVGSPLTIQIPPGYGTYDAAAGSVPPYNQYSSTIPEQWLRGGSDIAGATSPTYTTVSADGGQAVAARLQPSQRMAAVFAVSGYQVKPLITNAISVAKLAPVSTKTKVAVPKRFSTKEKVTMKVKVKAASGTPDGKVTVKIGRFKTQKTLSEGSALVNLPRLAPGAYKVKISYAGSDTFAASKAKKVKLTVTK